MSKKNPSRRSMLKGLSLGAGALILNQWIRQSIAYADVDSKMLPKRIVFIVQDNGIDPNHFVPVGVKRKTVSGHDRNGATEFSELPLENAELPATIAALTPFRKRMTILQGLSGRATDAGAGGHSTGYGALGCYRGSLGPVAQTIDSMLSDQLGGIIPHVALGIANKPEITLSYNISAGGPGKAIPMVCDPRMAYASLFGSVAEGSGRQQFDLKTNLLDFMTDDVRRAQQALPSTERQRLEGYVEAFGALYKRQDKIAANSDALKKHAPKLDERFGSVIECKRLEAQFDNAAAALISGLTNTVTLTTSGGGQQYITYSGIGITQGGHEIGHGRGVEGKTAAECMAAIRTYFTGQIARLAERLQNTPEGTGSILDNTLIVYLSDSGEAHHPNMYEWPILLIGNLGGRLKTNGRYLQFPQYKTKGHRTVTSLFRTLLQSQNMKYETFGQEDTALRDLKDSRDPLGMLLV